MSQHTDTGKNTKAWAVSQHFDTAPARIPRFGLCQNTLTSAKAQKAWAVSQHTETDRNTKAWAVSQQEDLNRQKHQGYIKMLCATYVAATFSRDKLLANSIQPTETKIKSSEDDVLLLV